MSLSTDDEGIFETDIERDCALAVEQTDLTYAEFKQMSFNSIETSFAPEALKARLKEQLLQSYKSFEAEFRKKYRSPSSPGRPTGPTQQSPASS